MAESYQDIMSRLNGGQQVEKPKAANDFATYVRTLLENPNPQGGMMGDASAYYADPFRKQNAINQAILDEELAKKKAEEEAAKAAAGGGGGGGMMSGGGDSAGDMGGRNYWADREAELSKTMSPEAVRAQILQEQVLSRQKFFEQITPLLFPGVSLLQGLPSLFSTPTKSYEIPWAQMSPQDKMYATNTLPPVSDSMMADAIQNDAIKNAVADQALKQQYGITLTDFGGPGDSVSAPYSPSSDGFSATGDGTGNYSTPSMSDPYGGVI